MVRTNRCLFAAACVLASGTAPTLAQSLTHIQTIDMSTLPVASPDTSGILYMQDSGTLLTVDSEVNETPLFVGDNAFELDLDGLQLDTFGLTGITGEPTGLAFDAVTGTLFIADDNRQDIYAIGAGPNGTFDGFPEDGGDDVLISRVRTDDFGSLDPEGLTFSPVERVLYMAAGAKDHIYRISPGTNGLFDGVPPLGDDTVTSFDTTVFGLTNPEGITFDPDTGHLYLVGRPRYTIFHVTVNGFLVRSFDVPVVDPTLLAGLTMAPSSLGAMTPTRLF